MKLVINPTRLISDMQRDFSEMFPFLRLEVFLRRSRQVNENKRIISGDKRIGDAQSIPADGSIDIREDMKVQDLERAFLTDFGLNVQVLRCSGNLWLQTTMTDSWTLRQQNEHGREISTTGEVKENRSSDYDLERDADH